MRFCLRLASGGFIILLLLFIFNFSILAQDNDLSSLAISVPVAGDIQNGDILCADKDGYQLCDKEYQTSIYGVITDKPSLAIETKGDGLHLVTTTGNAIVRVSGDIKKGDLVTTSTDKGVGKKAEKNGYVLGTAVDDSADSKVRVAINIHQTIDLSDIKSNILDVFRKGLSGIALSPLAAMRYALAALMVVISFVVGFIYFGRITKTGVEAIGRNPIARGTIQASVILHIFLTVGIALIGLGIAYLILSL